MPEVSVADWEDFTKLQPNVHLLQTSGWGELKNDFGWKAKYIISGPTPDQQLGAQVLFRKFLFNFTVAYIPKGPVGLSVSLSKSTIGWQNFLTDLDNLCHQQRSIFVIVEPDVWQNESPINPPGFSNGIQTIQPPRTIVIDLTSGENAVMARMKQKTRYNIRLAQKKGVAVRSSDGIDGFYRLMTLTGKRDLFGIHTLDYYRKAYQIFHKQSGCELLLAEFSGEALAGLLVFRSGSRAWYFYGASSDAFRELMPTYLIQWEAIMWAMRHGCKEYDMWGIPDENEEKLETDFLNRSDGLWGVYRFKRGFGGQVMRAAGPYERVYFPAIYWLYRRLLNIRSRNSE